MSRFILVQEDGRIAQIEAEKFAVHPSLTWIDATSWPQDDDELMRGHCDKGAFVAAPPLVPIEPSPSQPEPKDAKRRTKRS